ncbi:hypothetical protein [Bacteroides sp. 224]|uniref:hypothetical protein n=1 Tax=Bacteroides sp. 224 TaxID=2302936 RepID=UPI0013D3C72F|nr:hypothetical protein [Bacteroides sp. 224]NDV64013.1 hypothetical protein [Bacteroides sp. 224]
MNKARRQELVDVISHLDEAIDRVEEIKSDEQDAFDALPESFQNSARGDSMLEAMDQLDGLISDIETLKTKIDAVINGK